MTTGHDEGLDGVVLDQTKKLLYLLNVRGDQRTPIFNDPSRVKSHKAPLEYDSIRVTNQATLAEALGVDAPIVNRWIGQSSGRPRKIDHVYRDDICQIYAISLAAFSSLPFDKFKGNCESERASWRKMLAEAAFHKGIVTHEEPFHRRWRYARVQDNGEPLLPNISVEKPLWIEFTSPRDPESANTWRNWHIVLLNHDCANSSFVCYLPRYAKHTAFALTQFPPSGGMLSVPSQPVLKHPISDIGKEFEMVLVVSQEPYPAQLATALAQEMQGRAIDDALDELAGWLQHRIAQGSAAIARTPYLVVQ